MSALIKPADNLPSSDDAKPVLYSSSLSSCAWRVRIALGLKGIPYDIKTKSDSSEYKEVNPMQQVPTLRIDGHTLCDSVAIMQYLDETRPQHPLLPQDPYRRAKVLQIVQIICSSIQPLQNTCVLARVGEEKSLDWAQHWISRGFDGLEKVLSATSGKFCVGDEISIADCCLVPQVFNAKRYQINLSLYPTIQKLDHDLGTNTTIRACHPYNQPDCPQNLAD